MQEPGQVTFQLSFGSVSATDSTGAGTLTRAGRTEEEQVRIGRMWYVITDSRGERIALHTLAGLLAPDGRWVEGGRLYDRVPGGC